MFKMLIKNIFVDRILNFNTQKKHCCAVLFICSLRVTKFKEFTGLPIHNCWCVTAVFNPFKSRGIL